MFQKIPFSGNNNPIYKSEETKSFAGLSNGRSKGDSIVRSFPKQIFIAMLVLIISSILAFFLIPTDKETRSMSALLYGEARDAVSGELSLLFDLGGRAKRLAALQAEVERILLQDTINKKDSIFLENAMHELGYFKKPQTKEP